MLWGRENATKVEGRGQEGLVVSGLAVGKGWCRAVGEGRGRSRNRRVVERGGREESEGDRSDISGRCGGREGAVPGADSGSLRSEGRGGHAAVAARRAKCGGRREPPVGTRDFGGSSMAVTAT